jgi:VWFA-related protein
MERRGLFSCAWAVAVTLAAVAGVAARQQGAPAPDGQKPTFRTGVDLVHVTATVTDSRGHFVRGLLKDDFSVAENGQAQPIVEFSAERAPVSIGFALDTSSSMAGLKLREAKEALLRVMGEMLQPDDEVFLYTFSDAPVLQQGWTTDRKLLHDALDDASAHGRTALYDTVRDALLLLETGRYRKKVLLVVSDGNDTASFTPIATLRDRINRSEALVYAIAVATYDQQLWRTPASWPTVASLPLVPASLAMPQIRPPQRPPSFPPRPGYPPGPGGGRPPWNPPPPAPPRRQAVPGDAANVQALRELTDISGGRTEVVRNGADLGPATASVADELSRQYQLIYQATTRRDGRWHEIMVSVRDPSYQVRARKGYLAGKADDTGN